MSESASPPTAALQEVILTLPRPIILGLSAALIAGAGLAVWTVVHASAPGLQELAKSVLLVMLPLIVLLVAAIGIRRTSTGEVDQLVSAFLEKTVLQRFTLACRHHELHAYPFSEVAISKPAAQRSYVEFRLAANCPRCLGDPALARVPDVTVSVKMNVINFEVLVALGLRWPGELPPNALFDRENLEEDLFAHPLLRFLHGTIQGSVEEDYKIRVTFTRTDAQRIQAHFSFRQKLREHFLGSPFLRRYYSEDAAILIGVLVSELRDAGLLLPSPAGGGTDRGPDE